MAARTTPQKRTADDQGGPSPKMRKKDTETPGIGRRAVQVTVGTGKGLAIFEVHERLLIKHSDFFRTALNRLRMVGQPQSVSLPQTNSESFEIFQNFVYTGVIFSAKDGDLTSTASTAFRSGVDEEYRRLATAWKLGESILSSSFKDALVDTLIVKITVTRRYPTRSHQYFYPNSSRRSAIRRLLVDIAIFDWSKTNLDGQPQAPQWAEFFFDVAKAIKKTNDRSSEKAPYRTGCTCIYHEHEAEGKPCYRTTF